MQVERTKQGNPSWVELMTSDEAAGVAFYCQLFGWQDNASEMPQGGFYHTARVQGSAVAGMGQQNPEERERGIPPHWTVYLAADDADAVAAKVEPAGGKVLAPPFDVMELGRMAVISDPTGGTFGIWQARGHVGFERRAEPNTVSWCELITDDPKRATQFYSTVFGVPSQEMPMGDQPPYVLLGPEGEQGAGIMQKMPEMGQMPNVWGVYFEVADADATVQQARQLGADVLSEPQDIMPGRFAMLRDPQGAVFGVIKSNPTTQA